MKYKDYETIIIFDEQANIFYGEVINTRDVITFQGKTVEELRNSFQESIDNYLKFCAERGENPDKPFSGSFLLTIEPELHKKIFIQAKKERKSLNLWIKERLLSDV